MRGGFVPEKQSRRYVYTTMQRAVQADNGAKLRQIVDAIMDKAATGDVTAATWVRDTLDGKPTQAINLKTEDVTQAGPERPRLTAQQWLTLHAQATEAIDVDVIESTNQPVSNEIAKLRSPQTIARQREREAERASTIDERRAKIKAKYDRMYGRTDGQGTEQSILSAPAPVEA